MNLSSLPSIVTSIIFLVALVALSVFIPRSRPAVAGVLLSAGTLGGSLLELAAHQLPVSQVSRDLAITVHIASVPEHNDRRLSFMARVLSCLSCDRPLPVENVRLSWYGDYPEVRAGELWKLTVRLKPPATLRNPGGFDAVAWALSRGLHAKGYVRGADREGIKRIAAASGFSVAAIRQNAAERLETLSGSSSRTGLLQGLTVGIKSRISQEQWGLLRNTGTAHLLAISGLHIGLVAAWMLVAGRMLSTSCSRVLLRLSAGRRTPDPRPWVLAGSLSAAVCYAALAGFELPTQRAVLMLGVWMIAAIRFRFLPPMSALCVALCAVLSINALSLLSAGFWLSFGTVATLFYLHGGYQRHQSDWQAGKWPALLLKLRAIGRTHVLLGIVLLPVSAWFFQSGSLVAPLANLIAVPWVTMVCVPLSLLGLLASFLSEPAAALLLLLADHSLNLLLFFLQWLDVSDLSAVVLTLPDPLGFAFVMLGLGLILAPAGLRLRRLALPLFVPALLHNAPLTHGDGFEVHVLDVGQGLAALVYAGDETLLFDTGGRISSDLSMFEAVVVPFLQASGRRRVDTLVVSHGDEDHAFGVTDVIRRYPGVRVLASRKADVDTDHPVTLCQAGDQWSRAGVQFAFIHPAAADRGSDNDRSCVLLVFMGRSRVLLTGDIEAGAEHRIVSRLEDTPVFPVSMLTAPHHGSQTSSSQAFIDRMRPDHVVFPAGYMNRYGFPHSEVQLRYARAGSRSFTTGDKGAVSFAFGKEGLSVQPISWWDSRRRYWHGIVNPDCWQQFAGQSLALRLLALSQKGQTLCGK